MLTEVFESTTILGSLDPTSTDSLIIDKSRLLEEQRDSLHVRDLWFGDLKPAFYTMLQ